jgi:acyl-CoA synthetase (AMP-forming)/AMP-acid ligase II
MPSSPNKRLTHCLTCNTIYGLGKDLHLGWLLLDKTLPLNNPKSQKEGITATEKDIMDFVNERVAPYKVIRELEFRKEPPMTLVGKVLRRVLQKA